MTREMHLRLTTPQRLLVEATPVVSLRAEDATGSFGLLPGHCDFLTVLVPSVVRWQTPDGTRHYAAVHGGVLSLTDGALAIACREAVLGDTLDTLEARVRDFQAAGEDTARKARVEHLRLQSRALRQLVRYLRPQAPTGMPLAGDGHDAP